jgi:hypothetical protein
MAVANRVIEARHLDLTKWKPIPHDAYVEWMGLIAMSHEDWNALDTHIDQAHDLRTRVFVFATVVYNDDEGRERVETAPYLMTLHDGESHKHLCFMRTDCGLAHI